MVTCKGDVIGKRGNLTAIYCETHGYIHLRPFPSEQQYYQGDYHAQVKPNIAKEYADDSKWWNIIYGDWLSLVSSPINKWAIDVGAGTGNWIRYLRLQHWLTQGIEPDPNLARQHGFVRGSWRDATINGVGLISAHWVLEHVNDVDDFMAWAYKTLAPDGNLMITVPNDFTPIQYEAAKIIGKPYFWLHPEHANYFSKSSMRVMLERHGFAIKSSYGSWQPELFLRDGLNYLDNHELGRKLHRDRMARELNMWTPMRRLLRWINGKAGIGRDITVVAIKE